MKVTFEPEELVAILGVACLWPFVTFAPQLAVWAQSLKNLPAFTLTDNVTPLYTGCLALVFLVAGVWNNACAKALSGRIAVVVVGLAGMLAVCGFGSSTLVAVLPAPVLTFLALVLAVFVVFFFIGWGAWTLQDHVFLRMMVVLIASVLARLFSLVVFLAGAKTWWLYALCALGTALCFAYTNARVPAQRPFGEVCRQVPWVYVVPLVVLLFAASAITVYIDGLEISTFSVAMHCGVAALVALFAGALEWWLTRQESSAPDMLMPFAVVTVGTVGIMVLMQFFVALSGILLALRICLVMFLWVVFACVSTPSAPDAVTRWAVFGLLAVAPLGLRLFDFAAFQAWLVEHALLGPVVSVGVFVLVCAAVVWFVHSQRKAPVPAQQAEVSIVQPASNASEAWQRATSGAGLTERECDVVRLAAKGYSARSIAEELVVSEYTVKNHLSSIYRKCGVASKQELIKLIQSCQ